MKKFLSLILAAALLAAAGAAPALGAETACYPGTDIPDISACTSGIYIGLLCEKGSASLLYKLGTDDIAAFTAAMEGLGYTVSRGGSVISCYRSDGYGASLEYLPESDEYCLRLPSAYNPGWKYLDSKAGAIDPESLYAYAKRLEYNRAQGIYYFAMRPDDVRSYIASLKNLGFTEILSSDDETVLRGGPEAVLIGTMGGDKYQSLVTAVAITPISSDESDESAASEAQAKGLFAREYYQGNKMRLDSALAEAAAPIVKVYASMDRAAFIKIDDLARYKAAGWYESLDALLAASAKMYSADGRELYVLATEVENYKAVGWDTLPPVTMYAADGRTLSVLPKDIATYRAVGWHLSASEAAAENETVTMYALDGRTITVAPSRVDAHKAVGWDTEPPILLVYTDGSTMLSLPKDVPAYELLGWRLAE